MTVPPDQIPIIVAAVSSSIAAIASGANWVLATLRGHDRRLEAEARERMQKEDHQFRKWSYEHGQHVDRAITELKDEVHSMTPLGSQRLKE